MTHAEIQSKLRESKEIFSLTENSDGPSLRERSKLLLLCDQKGLVWLRDSQTLQRRYLFPQLQNIKFSAN